MALYSFIIKNGLVLDGTGEKPKYQADIAVKNDKIIKIGNLANQSADTTIDASNLYVAPGFIDITTHSDTHWTLFSQPLQESFIRQGVTTIIGGHGGVSLAPIIKPRANEVLDRWIDTSKINLNWRSIGEFFEELRKHNLGINFGTFIGLENLRKNVLEESKPAGKKEIKTLCTWLESAFKEGALGLSTNLGTQEGRTASNEELIELMKTVAAHGIISIHHLEDEGKNLLPAISRIIMLLRASASEGHISHIKALGRTAWENFDNAINMIELAQKDGVTVTCDFFPYTRTGSSLTSLLPSWILTENKEKILEMLKDPQIRQDITEYLKSLTLHYERIVVASTLQSTNSTGKSIREISLSSGLNEEKIILDLLDINDLQVAIFNEAIAPEHLDSLCKKPYIMFSSDGVGYEIQKIKDKNDFAHPRSFGTFPKFFSEFLREKSLIGWEETVYKMSGLPAKTLGLKKRGILAEGNYADITIFNPLQIRDKSTYDNPFQYAEGVEHVLVNGELVLSQNEIKKEGAGRVIKKE